MMTQRPRCVILAGPNGAGKTTHATRVVEGIYGIAIYINPDTIVAGFGAASVDSVAFDAGRIVLSAVDDCIRRGGDFAFETTLSGRRWPRLLDRLAAADYDVFLHYLWIPDADQCVARVAYRVSVGGHGVREEDIRRRHVSSIENCISVFIPRVNGWRVYNASSPAGLITIASGTAEGTTEVADPDGWRLFTSGTRRDTVREVAPHGYLNTPTRETAMYEPETMLVRTESANARAVGMPSPEIIEAESRIAVRRALAIHRALGVGAAFWEDGKVRLVPPEELPRDINDVEWTERQMARQMARRPR
jgi:predicted ABC-type ATPase